MSFKGKIEVEDEIVQHVSLSTIQREIHLTETIDEDFEYIGCVVDLPCSLNTLSYAPGENLESIFWDSSNEYKRKHHAANPQVWLRKTPHLEVTSIRFRRDVIHPNIDSDDQEEEDSAYSFGSMDDDDDRIDDDD